jgi:hypothetical protein
LSGRATRRCGTSNPERLPNHGAIRVALLDSLARTGLHRKPEQLSRRTRERDRWALDAEGCRVADGYRGTFKVVVFAERTKGSRALVF